MSRVRKAVITAAGLGTRLLPVTKEIPKEMLPIFVKGVNNEKLLKPLIQVIFEQLYLMGIREYFIIVGRGKRAIEDHFTPNLSFVKLLREKDKISYAEEIERFYEMIYDSIIVFL
ncbi:MAG: sugar phosphate nucleotidyltransferase, partial [bacterium]|nr:sugar phosphate nucleotidyltransferase [bacterium]